MSTNAKNSSMDKVLKEFNKHDLDEQIKMYLELKEALYKKLLQKETELQDKAMEYANVSERL